MDKSIMTDSENILYGEKLLKKVSEFRETGHMVDVMICVGMKEFPCHRLVLAAASPYFNAMFNSGLRETNEKQIFLKGLSDGTMEAIIGYFYDGQIALNCENALDVFEASDLFQVDRVKDFCVEFMSERITRDNCIDVWRLAVKYRRLDLERTALGFITENFIEIAVQPDFLALNCEELCSILTADRLNVPDEECVCEAACEWLYHDRESRICDFSKVLQHLRLPLVSVNYLMESFQPRLLDLNSEFNCILEEAKLFHLFPARQTEIDSERTKSRFHHKFRDVVVLFGIKQCDNETISIEVKCLDMATENVVELQDVPILQTVDFALCTYGSDIYISGGSKTPTDTIHFHSFDQKWKLRCPMNAGRSRHVMAAIGKNVYSLGGYLNSGFVLSVEQYSVTFDSWKTISSLKQAVCLTAAEAVGHNVYILGGLVSEQATTSVIQSFDSRTNEVTILEMHLPIRCALHRSTANQGKIFIVTRAGKVLEFSTASVQTLTQMHDFERGHYGTFFYHGAIHVLENDKTLPRVLKIHKYDTERHEWSTTIVKSSSDIPTIIGCARSFFKVV